MKFNKDLLSFDKDVVIYDNIDIGLTKQNLFDYVAQTQYSSEELILFYYKKSIDKIRDKQIEKILNEKNTEQK
jgi:hypothetical protein